MIRSQSARNLTGVFCFSLATAISFLSVWHHPSPLGLLYVLHNGLLAGLYLKRAPAKQYDRVGLWLGLIAAFLPTFSTPTSNHLYLLIPALFGYGWILWSLISIGPQFGIAPADRGITCRGPYRLIRHPMYLGELIFRLALAFDSKQLWLAFVMAILFIFLQCERILREEKIIHGYPCYAHLVPWRLVPHIW
jgi:protein-S-isoprenylcysteine O-methyltransferase Ste14